MKYEPSSLAMELPDLQVPSAKNVLFKTWYRIKDFFYIAFPLLVVGSIVVEVMLQYELLDVVVEPLSFITVDMLGLPAVCIIAFIVGILRKEMALGMLAILFGSTALELFMTPDQFVVFGVVMAVYMPCVATLITMWREIGWKETWRSSWEPRRTCCCRRSDRFFSDCKSLNHVGDVCDWVTEDAL